MDLVNQSPTSTIWDPLGEHITADTYTGEQQALLGKVQRLEASPHKPLFYLALYTLLPVAVVLLMIFLRFFNGVLLVIAVIPITFHFVAMQQLQKDVVLYLLCKENQWLYHPEFDEMRVSKAIAMFPHMFQKGRDQELTDEIWGSLKEETKTEFWYSQFVYTVGGGKSSHTYTESVIFLPVAISIPVSFSLTHPEYLFQFGKTSIPFGNPITTESEEFNKRFRIISDSTDMQTKTEILRVLSPSVQVRLVDLSNTYGLGTIVFSNNMLGITFTDGGWSPTYTKFYKEVAIDPRDEENFLARIKDMTLVPTEMVQFM